MKRPFHAQALPAGDPEKEPEPEGYARLDIHLREALRVLVDAVEIGRRAAGIVKSAVNTLWDECESCHAEGYSGTSSECFA